MTDGADDRVTRLLRDAAEGRQAAAAELLPLVYERLCVIARQRMAGERRDHTLQATALVHEAYLRLVGAEHVEWNGRAHFYHAAAEAMRRILVEHARARGRQKRGGDRQRVFGDVLDLAAGPGREEILAFDGALRRLGEQDPEAAAIVRLRFFAGLSVDETAAALGVSARTVDREWSYAKAWLYRVMEEERDG